MPEVLLVADLTAEDGESFATACEHADWRVLAVSDAPRALDLLSVGGTTPGCVFIDADVEGVESLVGFLRGDPRFFGLPVIALVAQPTEGAYVRAHAIGADDVALRSDPGTVTRRLAALGPDGQSALSEPWRGKAWLGHPSHDRRRVLGRVLRQAGYEVGFASGRSELIHAVTGDATAELVVIGGDLLDRDEGALIDHLRSEMGKPSLAAVVLRPPTPSDHAGETIERLGVVSDETAADNLLFVVNELAARPGGELRASQRLLFSTLCSFRRQHDITPEFGLTYNLSREGLYVRTMDPPKRGTRIWLELRPPGGTAIVHLRGDVVWTCEPGPSKGKAAPPGFGVRILEDHCPPADLARYRAAYQSFRGELRPYSVGGHRVDDVDEVVEPGGERQGRILVADDDPRILALYERVLDKAGYDVTTAEDGETAVALFVSQRFDAVLTDLEMPRLTGLELIREIRRRDETVPIVIATGAPSTRSAIEAVEQGAFRYLTKPVTATNLRNTLGRAIALGHLTTLKREALALHGDEIEGLERDESDRVFERALRGLYLDYQPIVSWSRREVYGYEALVRSKEPSLAHPDALFDAATELGRLDQIGREIRKLAPGPCAGMTPRLFVNLHPRDLLDEDLFSCDTDLAKMAAQVTLEITERASLAEIPELGRRVAELRAMGFSIAVDDIGSGYADLTSFAQLEPEVAKLDMTLIRDVHRVPTKQRLVRSFCELCADLGIVLIAEGVETTDERDALLDLGCDLLQGYLFARPGAPFPEPSF